MSKNVVDLVQKTSLKNGQVSSCYQVSRRLYIGYYYISNGDFIPELLSLDTSMWFIVYTLLPMQTVNHKTIMIHSNSCMDNIWVAGLQIQFDLLSLFY